MRDVFVAEELERRGDRARGTITQRAEGLSENRIGDVQQRVQVFGGAAAGFQAVVDLAEPERAFAARRALAAWLVFVEVDPTSDRPHHAGGLVENLQRLGAEHRPGCSDALVVQRDIQMLVGEKRCRRSARCPELQLVAGPYAVGVVKQFAQRDAQRRFVLAWSSDVSRQRIQREARRFLAAHRPEPIHAVEDDRWDAGDGLDVVDHRRAAVQASYRGEWRTQAWLAAAALPRGEPRRFL